MSTADHGLTLHPSRHARGMIVCSIATLLAMLILRYLGPSDLFDQTQPKTIAYTTDIIVHGGEHWILPIERGELPATKPPLYNWLAVPFVRWLGFNSEIGHKMPSIAAFLACWLILVRLGRNLGCDLVNDESLGWLAGLMFAGSYALFKLAYLARPDMLLTLWLLIAWVCATRALSGGAGRVSLVDVGMYWIAVALAGLTKGPAALVVVAYAVLAAKLIAGRWSAIRRLHPILGMLFVGLVCGAWVYGVWKINPAHLKQELWFNEIYGRVTGVGSEGTDHGTRGWLGELPYQSFYFITRFIPWSLMALWSVILLWPKRHIQKESPNLLHPSAATRWLHASALFMLIVIGLYSLSVGKRADYVAVAYPQAALLASWWMLKPPLRVAARWPWIAPLVAAINLATLGVYDHLQVWSPATGFGDGIKRFVDSATDAINAQPGEVVHCSAGQTHMQAVLGIAQPDQRREIAEIIARGKPFWVVAGRTQNPPHEFDQWLVQKRFDASAEAVVRSIELPRESGWPGQVTLWRVTPN